MRNRYEYLRMANSFLRAMFHANDRNMRRLWYVRWREALRNANRKELADA